MKFRIPLSAFLASVLVGIFLAQPSSGVLPPIPPPPYVPDSPAEDILMVQAYIEQGTPNILHLMVTIAVPTPPSGETLLILVTRLQGSTETVIGSYFYNGVAKTVHSFDVALVDGGDVDIALYAMLGILATDRAPGTGFYRIASLTAWSPDRFTDYESVGGVVLPINGVAILAPYLALIGLVAATAAVAMKKRRN